MENKTTEVIEHNTLELVELKTLELSELCDSEALEGGYNFCMGCKVGECEDGLKQKN